MGRTANIKEKEKIFIHRGRPRSLGQSGPSFWKDKKNYYTSVVMDETQYARVVETANERHYTIKEMMYRLIEASAAFDRTLYERLLAFAAASGMTVGGALMKALRKGLDELRQK